MEGDKRAMIPQSIRWPHSDTPKEGTLSNHFAFSHFPHLSYIHQFCFNISAFFTSSGGSKYLPISNENLSFWTWPFFLFSTLFLFLSTKIYCQLFEVLIKSINMLSLHIKDSLLVNMSLLVCL